MSGTYFTNTHGSIGWTFGTDDLPEGCVEISEELFEELRQMASTAQTSALDAIEQAPVGRVPRPRKAKPKNG